MRESSRRRLGPWAGYGEGKTGHGESAPTGSRAGDLLGPETAAQEYFVQMMPSLERKAAAAFRYLDPDAREEAVAETVAVCWKDYVACAAQGKQVRAGFLAYSAIRDVREGILLNGMLGEGYRPRAIAAMLWSR